MTLKPCEDAKALSSLIEDAKFVGDRVAEDGIEEGVLVIVEVEVCLIVGL